jgi:mannose-6-phosphate isomerase-like protein (cupin superfamily)
MKKGYKENIETLTVENNNFRKVLYTGQHMQLVLMSLKPGEEIGLETHTENDQFFRFEKGQGKVLVNETEYTVGDGDTVIIPSGAEHNIINVSETEDLKMYTIYAPAHHKDGVVRATKEEAQANSPEFDGLLSE